MLVIVKRLIHTNEVCLPDAWKNSSKIESRNLFILWIEITIRLTTSLHNIPPGFSQQIQVSKVSDLGQLLKYISNICYISYMVWTLVYTILELSEIQFMNMKLRTLPSGLVLTVVVGWSNPVGVVPTLGFVVRNFDLVVSMSLPLVPIEVSLLTEVWPAIDVSLNEAVTDADVEPGAIEVVVSGVSVNKRNRNLLIYHKGISAYNTQKFWSTSLNFFNSPLTSLIQSLCLDVIHQQYLVFDRIRSHIC